MKDGGDVGLGPVDGERKTGDEDDDGARVDGEDLLDELFLGEVDALAVAAFATVAGDGAGKGDAGAIFVRVPVVAHVGAAGGVIANDDDCHVRGAGCFGGGAAGLIGGVIRL